MIKKIIATAVAATVLLASYSSVFASSKKFDSLIRESVVPQNKKESLSIDKDIIDETVTNYADYSVITFKTISGQNLSVSVSGSSMNFDLPSGVTANLVFLTIDGNTILETDTATSMSVDLTGQLAVNTMYYLSMTYVENGYETWNSDIIFTLTPEQTVTFVESPIYDFNVERCSEWWTDATSLEECLQPQNDVECDNPEVIARAQEITTGCNSDYEKVFAIYQYILTEVAYDYAQTEDYYYVYQDDVLTLLRREIAICEGMGNMFTALCRAVGVPACVSFGIGGSFSDFLDPNMITDESPNHAWAAVCLDGSWYSVDPTWDDYNSYYGDTVQYDTPTYNWYLQPLETFSFTHKICDADTTHGIESSGSCGPNATYSIDRAGTVTISGSGEVIMPYGVNGFSRVVFAEGSNITSIGESAFIDCDIITSVVLPDTVTMIDSQAFFTCEDLEYVIIPDSVIQIGDSAFDLCDELAYVYIPDSVSSMGDYAFDDCPRLIISVPSNLTGFNEGYYVPCLEITVRS
ncbi:MAG TPA: leucine-rich repeat protein [Saccharofermentans sp.]|nr:leucine-rich repeat protein [Clostridia bacterium]HPM74497.1 leucine-rich repeat protein [Saccharofermentans sp.]HUM23563.1 leucine-rich repeat protein [Saccharofermentans sp.]